MSFMGTYQNNVDPKGRVSIPVKYRDALGEHFYVTKGFDRCIDIYTTDEWEKFAGKLHKLSVTKRDMRDFVRFIFGNATDVELDKQGRILLPSMLRETVGIEKEVVVMGVGNKIEIWDRATWEEHQEELAQHISDISENVGTFDVDVDFDF
jgi:MraZ protein